MKFNSILDKKHDEKLNLSFVTNENCRKLYEELKAEEDERLAKEAAELAALGGDGATPVKEEDASVSGKKGGKSSAK